MHFTVHFTSLIINNFKTQIEIYLYIRGGTVHVFVSNRHGTGISVRCTRPYNEYRQFTLNPEGGAQSNVTASRRTANANGDTEAAALMFGSLYFILIKYQLAVKLAMLELMCVCVCVCARVCVRACVCVCVCARAPARSLQLFPYTSRINFKHLLSY